MFGSGCLFFKFRSSVLFFRVCPRVWSCCSSLVAASLLFVPSVLAYVHPLQGATCIFSDHLVGFELHACPAVVSDRLDVACHSSQQTRVSQWTSTKLSCCPCFRGSWMSECDDLADHASCSRQCALYLWGPIAPHSVERPDVSQLTTVPGCRSFAAGPPLLVRSVATVAGSRRRPLPFSVAGGSSLLTPRLPLQISLLVSTASSGLTSYSYCLFPPSEATFSNFGQKTDA